MADERVHRELQELSRRRPRQLERLLEQAQDIIWLYREVRYAERYEREALVSAIERKLEDLGEPTPERWRELRKEVS